MASEGIVKTGRSGLAGCQAPKINFLQSLGDEQRMSKEQSTDAKSIYDMCKEALDIQDACNMYPILSVIQEDITALRLHGMGNDEIYRHPVIICLIDKLSSLAGIQGTNVYTVYDAYDYCLNVVKRG